MVLVDTSVWIAHFRSGLPSLAEALGRELVLAHPIVIGELATGNLQNRTQTLADLRRLPHAEIGTFEECLYFIETHKHYGLGIGWSDIQLLVSAMISRTPLWTLDKRLAESARELEILYLP